MPRVARSVDLQLGLPKRSRVGGMREPNLASWWGAAWPGTESREPAIGRSEDAESIGSGKGEQLQNRGLS